MNTIRRLILVSVLFAIGTLVWADDGPTPTPIAPATIPWEQHPNLMLDARREISVGVVGEKIYVAGGYYGGHTLGLRIFDTNTGIWSYGTSMSSSHLMTLNDGASWNNLFYVTPGHQSPTFFEYYDPSLDSWSELPSKPIGRTDDSVTAVGDGKIFVLGGLYSNAVDIYDTASATWTVGAPMPMGLNQCTPCYVDGKLYVFGGGNSGSTHVDTLYIYDTVNEEWHEGATMPGTRVAAYAIPYGNHIFLIGGNPGNKVWIYNRISDVWQTATDIPRMRHYGAAARVGDIVYVLGGTDGYGGSAQSVVDMFDLTQVTGLSEPIDIPALEIVSPNGGEVWTAGTSQEIIYQVTGAVSAVDLDVDYDGIGTTWNSIASGIPASGTYAWTVPPVYSNTCQMRVCDASNSAVSDTSDGYFTIVPTPTPTPPITVVIPNGGEVWTVGETEEISYSVADTISSVSLEINYDGNGIAWDLIAGGVPASGTYAWTIPLVYSNQCRVRVTDASNSAVWDRSDDNFTIRPPLAPTSSLEISAPNGGEVWTAGTTEEIVYYVTDTISAVDLEVDYDGMALTWHPIASGIPASGTYTWMIPPIYSNSCLVRISDVSDSAVWDISNNHFTIVPPPAPTLEIVSPNGGEVWTAGEIEDIVYHVTGSISAVDLEVDYEGMGMTWDSIASGIPASGTYSWTIPPVYSNTCLVRISDASFSSASDVSDGNFAIVPQPLIEVVTPNGGEEWTSGTIKEIVFNATVSISVVNLDIDYDGIGMTWDSIASGVPASGTYAWTVPEIYSNTCLVRVSDASNNTISDISDNTFSIVPPVPVLPLVASVAPSQNSIDAASASVTLAVFTTPMVIPTASAFTVRTEFRGNFPGVITGVGTDTLEFHPSEFSLPGEKVEVSLAIGLQSADLISLATPFVWQYASAAGIGPGAFSAEVLAFGSTNAATASILFGDVDNDRDLDLLVGRYGEQDSVYLNHGNGNFVAGPIIGLTSEQTSAVAFGDVDNDGDLDAAVGIENGQNVIYLNNGMGAFDAGTINFGLGNDSPSSMEFGDADGDGDIDLFVGNVWPYPQNLVYLNDGAGNFNDSHAFGPSYDWTRSIAVGDVDNDGDLDIAVGNIDQQLSRIYLNDGLGNFDSGTLTFGGYGDQSYALAFGDVDGDGDLDIAEANLGLQNVVYLNDGQGHFDVTRAFGSGSDNTLDVLFGDVDGDGDLDIVAANQFSESSVYLNDGAGNFSQGDIFRPADTTPIYVALGDVDGDGDLDLAQGIQSQQAIIALNSLGTPPNQPPVANAGEDQVVECSSPSGASVVLDGSASYDPDGGILEYNWEGALGPVSGVTATISLPLGTYDYVLSVTDGIDSSTDSVRITVEDTTPPEIICGNMQGLTAYWPFDGDAHDESGNGYDGTIYGAQTAQGIFGQGYHFVPGTYIDSNYAPVIQPEESISISSWVKMPSYHDPGYIWGLEKTATDSLCLYIPFFDCLAGFTYSGSGLPGVGVFGPDVLCDGMWHHFTAVKDADQGAALYVDGLLVAGMPGSTGTINASNPSTLFLGGNNHDGTLWTDEFSETTITLDEIVIFERALDSTEIQMLAMDGNSNGVIDFWEQNNDIVAEAENSSGAVVTYPTPTVSDNCDPSPVVVCAPSSGSLFPLGDTIVSCTATDMSGNIASCSFTVSVVDTTAPDIECPADLIVECEGGGQQSEPEWELSQPADNPGPRELHALAYDSLRGEVVLFGGRGTSASGLDETWVWDGMNWEQKQPSIKPSGRKRHAMVYDSARDRVVLFGGTSFLNDTWEWDGTNWEQKHPLTMPDGRENHAMAYDSTRGRVVLFGGYNGSQHVGDTWEWDGTNWEQKYPVESPSPRTIHAMAYDSARNRVILFGGGSPSDEMWEWDGTNWQEIHPVTRPSARGDHGMVYDSARDRLVLFGGGGTPDYLGDLWEWDGTNWEEIHPMTSPCARNSVRMVYDSLRGRVVLFGGYASGQLSDTWELIADPTGTVVTYATPVVFDICDPDPTVECYPPSGSLFAGGDTIIDCTATDASGNSSNCSFIVSVTDTTPPVIILNGDSEITLECCESDYIEFGAIATDICDPNVPVVIGGDVVDVCSPGTYLISYDAADDCGNAAATIIRTVYVVDQTPPDITCPDDISVQTQDASGAEVTYPLPSVSDICDPSPTIVCDPPSGSLFPVGTTIVDCTATDACGNESFCSFAVTVEAPSNDILILLRDSFGYGLSGGTAQYYSGGWHDIPGTTDINGELQFTKPAYLDGTVPFRITYAYATQQKSFNITNNPTVLFQTTNVAMRLRDSQGGSLDAQNVFYYSGGWRTFGNGVMTNGEIRMELLPLSYPFRLTYAFATQQKSQNVALDQTVSYQTKDVIIKLEDSCGNPLDGETVQYYSGGWHAFCDGTMTNGEAHMELLSLTYPFRMTFGDAKQQKSQNVGEDATVVFRTTSTTIELRDHEGDLLSEADSVEYYSGGWHTFGNGVTIGGQVGAELLPLSYPFRLSYAHASQQQSQNIASASTVVFQTTSTTIELRDHEGNLLSEADSVEYYAGGWYTFGTGVTSGGQVCTELLPLSYPFRLSYAHALQQQSQNIASASTVVFQTTLVTVELRDHEGDLLGEADTVEYYAGGWYTFGAGVTSGGQVSTELLPLSYPFRLTYAHTSNQNSQNVDIDPIVIFQSGQIADTSFVGSITQYYASGWQPFINNMQLLPGTYPFRFSDQPQGNYEILGGQINYIPNPINESNDAPVAEGQSVSLLEDTSIGITLTASDTENDPLTYILLSEPSLGLLSGTPPNLTYTPNPNAYGNDAFSFKVHDEFAVSNPATVNIAVIPVNDPPSFTIGSSLTVNAGDGTQTIPQWAEQISAGAVNEASQTLSFDLIADNPGLFASLPMIDATGTLSFTPAPDANGLTVVQVTLHDNGGTLNGGLDTSPTTSFTLNIQPDNQNIVIRLLDSQDSGLSGGTAQYYKGGWHNIPGSTDGNGELLFTKPEDLENTIPFRLTYAYATQQKSFNITTNPTVHFQTTLTTIKLQDSQNGPLEAQDVFYYSGGWHTFGSGSMINGEIQMELLPLSYPFRLKYADATQQQSQDISQNPIVAFQTRDITMRLFDSRGFPLDGEQAQYYSGGWHTFGDGTVTNGETHMELLGLTYPFRVTYGYATQQQNQNVAENSIVQFHTENLGIELRDSTNSLLSDADSVQYYSGGWRTFGNGVTSGGQVNAELFLLTYPFRLTYAYATQQKSQNVALASPVVFQTTLSTVELRDHEGSLLGESDSIEYYAGGWHTFGNGITSGGQLSTELLPLSYPFRLSYAYASQQKTQNIASASTTVFQTTLVTIELRDHEGDLLGEADAVEYYAGGWHTFGAGITTSGQVSTELLPLTYPFRLYYAFASNQKNQDVSGDPVVQFQSGQVIDASPVGLITQYYAGGWRTFIDGMQLLPGTYPFRFSDLPQGNYEVQGGQVNTIPSP